MGRDSLHIVFDVTVVSVCLLSVSFPNIYSEHFFFIILPPINVKVQKKVADLYFIEIYVTSNAQSAKLIAFENHTSLLNI